MDFLCLYWSKGVPAERSQGGCPPSVVFRAERSWFGQHIFEKTLQKDFNFSDDYNYLAERKAKWYEEIRYS